jgi:hypothetical protein
MAQLTNCAIHNQMKMIKKKNTFGCQRFQKFQSRPLSKSQATVAKPDIKKERKLKKQDFFPKVKKIKISFNCKFVLHFVFRNTQTDCLFFQFQPNPREINSSAL